MGILRFCSHLPSFRNIQKHKTEYEKDKQHSGTRVFINISRTTPVFRKCKRKLRRRVSGMGRFLKRAFWKAPGGNLLPPSGSRYLFPWPSTSMTSGVSALRLDRRALRPRTPPYQELGQQCWQPGRARAGRPLTERDPKRWVWRPCLNSEVNLPLLSLSLRKVPDTAYKNCDSNAAQTQMHVELC